MSTTAPRLSKCIRRFACSIAVLVAAVAALGQPSPTVPEVEGSFHGFPVLRDLQGNQLADGEFSQWVEGGRLHIRNTYDFGAGHRIVETVAFRLAPLTQEEWMWRETRGSLLEREYAVDLRSGQARAAKRQEGKTREWTERLEIEPGRTFAGVGFTVAIRDQRARLLRGETIELRAVGFTPKPRLVKVKLAWGGTDQMVMSGRQVLGDRFVVKADIPAVAKLIIAVPDTRIWLAHPAPGGFLRWEGPLAEPKDAVVRVDLLPGDPSGPAEPLQSNADPAPTGR